MERHAEPGADGASTFSTDSSLQELIEAELRTRQQQEQDQEQQERLQEPLTKPAELVPDQPESILQLEKADCARADAISVEAVVGEKEDAQNVTDSEEVTRAEEVAEPGIPEPETCVDVAPEPIFAADVGAADADETAVAGADVPESDVQQETDDVTPVSAAPETAGDDAAEDATDTAAVTGLTAVDTTDLVRKQSLEEESPSILTKEDDAPLTLTKEDDPPVILTKEDDLPVILVNEDEPPAIPTKGDVSLVILTKEDELPVIATKEDDMPVTRTEDDELPRVLNGEVKQQSAADAAHEGEAPRRDSVKEQSPPKVAEPVPDAVSPVPADVIVEQSTTKVSDEESDEGVGDGAEMQRVDAAGDAKKLRRKKKPDSDAERMGSARPALDSEGDSDISSEGSSGASSLTRSQDSGAGPEDARLRQRLSESSDGAEHDDQLSAVNLRQLRSSYLTNLDTTNSNARATHKLDTGVSIKNLKNTYAGGPVPAPRGSAGADLRPRELSKITVDMASLKSVYSSEGGCARPAAAPRTTQASPRTAQAELPSLSLTQIRAAYVQQAQASSQAPLERPIRTGVSIEKLRSSFGKDSPAADHTRIHVRSFDSSKAIKRFNKDPAETAGSECRACGRQAFQMERVSAEKAVWHKNCFRCSECAKQMTVDTYASHEGRLYCAAHHRQLLKAQAAHPAVSDETVTRPQPAAVQPGEGSMGVSGEQDTAPAAEIVKASNKADYGLEDIQNINVKDRFSVFERNHDDDSGEREPAAVEVKRSQSILSKMKKFQERDAPHDNGADADDSASDVSGDESRAPRDPDVVRSTRKTKKERPMSFSGLGDVKSRFESGGRRGEEAQDASKDELAKMRDMICGGNPRASYERAVQEAESPRSASREEAVTRHRAADMASRFERGDVSVTPDVEHKEDDSAVIAENGAARDARSLFHTMDSSTASEDHATEDATLRESTDLESADPELLNSDTTKRMLNKFKQMEQTGAAGEEQSTPREVARGNARQMLSKYRELQEHAQKGDLPDGPPPPKSFTPPPEQPAASPDLEEATEDSEGAEDPDIVRASHKVPDEFLNKPTLQARSLRDKFESWEPRPAAAAGDASFSVEEDCRPSLDVTRSLRAKFESLTEPARTPEKPSQQPRASKFIMEPSQAAETCSTCSKRVYAMERLEVDKRILHKSCFRCSKCNCVLRMDTYTFNAGKLFCIPHFKQMFKTKGNYDEGFGVESRTKHWSSTNGDSHPEQPTTNGDSGAALRPEAEPAEPAAAEQHNGDHSDPEPESEPESEPEPEPEPESQLQDTDVTTDVFEKVYESTVSEAM